MTEWGKILGQLAWILTTISFAYFTMHHKKKPKEDIKNGAINKNLHP